MFARLHRHPVEPGPLSLRDLDSLLARLPVRERAAVAWAPQTIRGALRQLLEGPPDPALVAKATVEVIRAFHGCWPVLSAIFANPGALRAEIEGHWRQKLPLLREYLADPAVADEAEWAFRAVGSMFDLMLTIDPEEFTSSAEGPASGQVLDVTGDDAAGLLRAQVLLMAVLEAAEQGDPPAVAAELAELAYDEAAVGVAALARLGLRIDPFRGESAGERGTRLLRYADHARVALSSGDMAALEAARLQDLR
ncbi:MAG: hypothetical protein HY906_26580 [Deltaproteobacteria bacterium]|nr:hypothetical protein [Deltaproteobacteria bacterium]